MSDYYFRGTLNQFWSFVYIEWQSRQSQAGFELLQPDPAKISVEGYTPARYDEISLAFYVAGHRECAVLVTAASVLDADLVGLEVGIHIRPLERYGDSVLQGWQELKSRMLDRGLLINPHALLGAISPIPPQPTAGVDLAAYFDHYHRERAQGRKCTLKDIAAQTGFQYTYVRQLHAKYLRERHSLRPKTAHKTTHKK